MPQDTVVRITATSASIARIIPAIEWGFGREDDETSMDMFERWLRITLGDLVHRYEKHQLEGTVPFDHHIIDAEEVTP